MKKIEKKQKEQGFTLIELSVVIVIIGLLVGGILVGRDLIKNAELRATIAQIDKYNTAVQTFKLKFNAVPGDIRQSEASSFGLFALTSASPVGYGDGNGLVEAGGTGVTSAQGETLVFWRHMFEAGFVDGSLGVNGNSVLQVANGIVTANVNNVAQSLPPSKLSPENSFIVYAANGLNYFSIMPIGGITTAGAYTFNTIGLTPISAFSIDSKLDDGRPNTGAIIARSITAINTAPTASGTSAANTCTIGAGTATDTYNGVIATGGNDLSCGIRVRFQ